MYPQLLGQDFLLQAEPQGKLLCITEDSDQYQMLRIIQENSIFQHNPESVFHLSDMDLLDQPSEHQIKIEEPPQVDSVPVSEKRRKRTIGKKREHKKNSNVVKKMGRLILNHIEQYKIEGRENEGLLKMQQMLKERYNKKSKCPSDGFNTYHLQALFNTKDKKTSALNMKTTRRIFTKLLREQVLKSIQIKGQAKILYLNTLKCCSLRLVNRKLAGRLQASQNQR